MIKRIFVFVTLMFGAMSFAWADYPAVATKFFQTAATSAHTYATIQEACDVFGSNGVAYYNDKSSSVGSSTPYGYPDWNKSWGCNVTFKGGTTVYQYGIQYSITCPYGGTLNGVTCKGADPPPSCKQGQSMGSYDVTTSYATSPKPGSALAKIVIQDGGLPSATYCMDKCTAQPDPSSFADNSCKVEETAGANGYYRVHCSVGFKLTGGTCTVGNQNSDPSSTGGPYPPIGTVPDEPSTKNDGNGNCPKGSVASGVDSQGRTICVGNAPPSPSTSNTETTKPSTTTTDSAGNSVVTEISSRTNADGSTTTTTTTITTAPDGTKVVAVKQDTGKATSGSQGIKDSDMQDLCAKNPNLNICKNSQVLGSCGNISCTGDAIQCATLRAAAAMQCQQKQDRDDILASKQYADGKAALAAGPMTKDQVASKLDGGQIDLSNPVLDKAGWIGGGACISDKSFSVLGQPVTVSFSRLCENIQPLRAVVMLMASVVSFMLIGGAFKAAQG